MQRHDVQRGWWLGALAGLFLSAGDWLGQAWYLAPELRLSLAWRLVCTHGLGGGALGAGLAAAWGLFPGPGDPSRVGHALLRSVWSWPLLAWVAAAMMGGGAMRQLPLRPLWQLALTLFLLAGSAGALWASGQLLAWARRGGETRGWGLGGGLGLLAAGLGLLDQRYLPGHYEYLHGCLTICALGLWALALAVVGPGALRGAAGPGPGGRLLRAGFVAALVAGSVTHLATLDANQRVRASLLSYRASHSHSVMWAASPLLALRDRMIVARRRARTALARQEAIDASSQQDDAPLPTWPDAHVLLITVDALRADHLGAYGYGRPLTPQLDALAATGVRFERAYTSAPHSSFALTSLMASEYLHQTLPAGTPPPEHTLASALREAAYYTSAFYTDGIFHTEGERLKAYRQRKLDFEQVRHTAIEAERMTDLALAEINATHARGEPNSLFWVHYFDVHAPYAPGPFGKADVDRYDGEIARTDRAIGRLVREARRVLDRELLIIVSADHGEAFREHGDVHHGSSLHDEQLRVPLIVAAPQLPPAVVTTPVSLLDVAPTILSMLGFAPPHSMRGLDLRRLALGHPEPPRTVFSTVNYRKMALRWPHKLIADLRYDILELYDLSADPGEHHNLADSERARADGLREEVRQWLDGLAAEEGEQPTPEALALRRGRLLDRRAVPDLAAILAREDLGTDLRVQAAEVLTRLADTGARQALRDALDGAPATLADEIAIALGRLRDDVAAPRLVALLDQDDPRLRMRAAVSLGRLGDASALPVLLEAASRGESIYERQSAIRCLGALGDPRALKTLEELSDVAQLEHVAVNALGRLGDGGALPVLERIVRETAQTGMRDRATAALGRLADPRALPTLLALTSRDPGLRNVGESLVRTGGLASGAVGGTDGVEGSGEWSDGCTALPLDNEWKYLHRTTCTGRGPVQRVTVHVPQPVADAPGGSDVLLSVRGCDGEAPATLELHVGGRLLGSGEIDEEWRELRWHVPHGELPEGEAVQAELQLDDAGAITLDHLLLVPRPATADVVRGG